MSNNTVSGLVTALTSVLANPAELAEIEHGERLRLLETIRQVQRVVELPQLTLQRSHIGVQSLVAMRVGLALGIFDAFAARGQHPMPLSELNAKTVGSEHLTRRFMRILAAQGVFEETARDVWQPLGLAALLQPNSPEAYSIINFYDHLKSYALLYEYLKSTDFSEPGDVLDGPWQYALNTSKSYQQCLSNNTDAQLAFDMTMRMFESFRTQHWFDLYPVKERLSTSSEQVMLVDIGGGMGQDACAFRKRFPDLPGRIIVQDVPTVINGSKEPPLEGIELMAHDMFTPQPLRGPRAFYMRTVMHDFPDKQAKEALRSIRNAMTAESVLLINENIMPEEKAPPSAPSIDLIVMALFAGKLRTEEQWHCLLADTGFKVTSLWKASCPEVIPTCLFEAVRV